MLAKSGAARATASLLEVRQIERRSHLQSLREIEVCGSALLSAARAELKATALGRNECGRLGGKGLGTHRLS